MIDYTNINSIVKDLARQSETIILDQLNEFISRGLIVVHRGPMNLVQDHYTDKVTIQSSVKLVLKDQEYIEQLEKENKALKEQIERTNQIIRNAFPKEDNGWGY